ncbi:MAG: hypothetical protein R6W87_01130, partial [Halospina sp.]
MREENPVMPEGLSVSDHSVTDPDALLSILDNVDALIYVSDMDTYDMLFMNAYGRRVCGDVADRERDRRPARRAVGVDRDEVGSER